MKTIIVNYSIALMNGNILDSPVETNRYFDRTGKDKIKVTNDRNLIKEFTGIREFKKESECERFLKRLKDLKYKLAARAAGVNYSKESDFMKLKYGSYQYTREGEKSIKNNVYKLSVNIKTI